MPKPLTIFKLLDRILLLIFNSPELTAEERGALVNALHEFTSLLKHFTHKE